ncbi:hypothetical protein Btru_065078 [Bulinus truncatus]|nr:hypothetical protein Btru_065078 [Bulinus truncatus]
MDSHSYNIITPCNPSYREESILSPDDYRRYRCEPTYKRTCDDVIPFAPLTYGTPKRPIIPTEHPNDPLYQRCTQMTHYTKGAPKRPIIPTVHPTDPLYQRCTQPTHYTNGAPNRPIIPTVHPTDPLDQPRTQPLYEPTTPQTIPLNRKDDEFLGQYLLGTLWTLVEFWNHTSLCHLASDTVLKSYISMSLASDTVLESYVSMSLASDTVLKSYISMSLASDTVLESYISMSLASDTVLESYISMSFG